MSRYALRDYHKIMDRAGVPDEEAMVFGEELVLGEDYKRYGNGGRMFLTESGKVRVDEWLAGWKQETGGGVEPGGGEGGEEQRGLPGSDAPRVADVLVMRRCPNPTWVEGAVVGIKPAKKVKVRVADNSRYVVGVTVLVGCEWHDDLDGARYGYRIGTWRG